MKWVPILNIVLTVVFYAMFPVLFPLFLMPETGVSTLRGYVTGFFYLAAWGPLYVVLHMIMMGRGLAYWRYFVFADIRRIFGYLLLPKPIHKFHQFSPAGWTM